MTRPCIKALAEIRFRARIGIFLRLLLSLACGISHSLPTKNERALLHLFHLHAESNLSCGHHTLKMNGVGLLSFLYLFHDTFAKDTMPNAIAYLESNLGRRILPQTFFHALNIGETFCLVFICQRRIVKKSVRIDIKTNQDG